MPPTQLVQIPNELGVRNRPMLNTNFHSILACTKGNIYRSTQVMYIATRFGLAAEVVQNSEIEVRYVATVDTVPTQKSW